jgi:molecular chaperone GrpE
VESKVKPKKHENKEVIELKEKIKELENKILYKDAELINYRKRKDDEVSSMLKYANSDLILELLPIVDDFERAITLDNEVLDDELSKFLSGFKMIYTRLIKILNDLEVKEIDALNKEFNPTYHQAVLTSKVEGVEPNKVIEVLQKGYMYKDKIIRPSMVKVSE